MVRLSISASAAVPEPELSALYHWPRDPAQAAGPWRHPGEAGQRDLRAGRQAAEPESRPARRERSAEARCGTAVGRVGGHQAAGEARAASQAGPGPLTSRADTGDPA